MPKLNAVSRPESESRTSSALWPKSSHSASPGSAVSRRKETGASRAANVSSAAEVACMGAPARSSGRGACRPRPSSFAAPPCRRAARACASAAPPRRPGKRARARRLPNRRGPPSPPRPRAGSPPCAARRRPNGSNNLPCAVRRRGLLPRRFARRPGRPGNPPRPARRESRRPGRPRQVARKRARRAAPGPFVPGNRVQPRRGGAEHAAASTASGRPRRDGLEREAYRAGVRSATLDGDGCGRGVAQSGSAPALGAGGPRFESGRPDSRSSWSVGPPMATD